MTYVEIVTGDVIETKYVPDQCDCGAFLTKGGVCNKCGDMVCNCGDMVTQPEECFNCHPELEKEYLQEDIDACKESEGIKDCNLCPNKDYCSHQDEMKELNKNV